MHDLAQLTRDSIDAWNRHDLNTYLTHYAEDAVYVGPRRRVEGMEQLRRYFEMLMEAFPNEQATVRDTAVSGSTVYLRYSDTAVHEGTMRWSASRQLGATGRSFTYEGVTEVQYNHHGKITFAQDFFDLYELLFVDLDLPFPAAHRDGAA